MISKSTKSFCCISFESRNPLITNSFFDTLAFQSYVFIHQCGIKEVQMNKKFFKFLFYCLAFSGMGSSLIALNFPPTTTQRAGSITNALNDLDSIVNNALDVFNVPGLAIGVVIDGKIVLSKGYGYRNLDQSLPVTENTLFAIGSCTKAFTTFMLGQLVDEGKINWDDPVITYIPEFRLMDQYTTHHITIRDLVAHRSGLARHDLVWFNPEFTRSDVIRSLQHLEPACNLREKFQYNNLLYTVAGILVEKVTGQTWEEALSSRVLIPLAMLNSNASFKESQKGEDYSLPYAVIAGEIKAIPFRSLTSVAPAGAINSSVSDMLNWIQLQLSNGTFIDKRFIRKETLQEMHTIQMPIGALALEEEVYGFGYGLGWCNGIYRGNYYLNHGGGVDGFISQVSLLPQQKIGVVVLSNSSSDGSYIVSSITNTIIDKLLDKADIDWVEKSKNMRDQVKKIQQDAPIDNNELNSMPAHKFEEYVGYYEHPAYGIVQVKLEDNRLMASYGDMTISLSHKCYDIFNGKTDQALFGDKSTISFSFSNNTSGDICELLIPLDQSVKPIVFKKKADNDLFSIDYLKQFEGIFGDSPLPLEVTLKGNKLILISPGEEAELVPDKMLKFSLKGHPGHSVQFVPDDNSKVSELLFIYPLGLLNLKINH